jgi:hypothetical protein
MAYSTDGITWKAVKDPKIDDPIMHVAYGNGRWLASTNGNKYASGNSMSYSADGVTWTAVTEKIDSSCVNDIIWGSGKFIASCNDGVIAYSANGLSWTNAAGTTFGSNDYINSIGYSGSKYIAVGYKRNNDRKNYAYSTDGVTWTAGSGNLNITDCIAWGGGVWVAGSGWINFYYSEDDGNTWKQMYVADPSGNAGVLSGNVIDIAYGNGTFAAVGTRNLGGHYFSVIVYSADGKNWTIAERTSSYWESYSSVAWGDGMFVAVGSNGMIAYSTDGVNWTAADSVFDSSANIYDVSWGGGKFVAAGYYF